MSMNTKKIKNLIISFFEKKAVYDSHKNDNDLKDSLSFVKVDINEPMNWKQAFKGSICRTGMVVCTLPKKWQECVVVFQWDPNIKDRHTTAFILNKPCDDGKIYYYDTDGEICFYVEQDMLVQSGTGNGSDGCIKEVYWR